MDFTDEQLRICENLSLVYDAWLDLARSRPPENYRLGWKTSAGREYLYEFRDRVNNGRSLGPRSEATEALYAGYQEQAEENRAWVSRSNALRLRIGQVAAQYRALKLPLVDTIPGKLFREIDRLEQYGAIQVAGTHCFAAYEIDARRFIDRDLLTTADVDFTLDRGQPVQLHHAGPALSLLEILRAVDPTFTVNMEKPFQARNATAYEVEFLMGTRDEGALPASERIRPVPLPEQDWLLRGTKVSHVVLDRSGLPARIVAPDPRWLALHKLWLANKPERNKLKVDKDWSQGVRLLGLIEERMDQYPLDDAFRSELPRDLRPYFEAYMQGDLHMAIRRKFEPAEASPVAATTVASRPDYSGPH